jgi:hypothetical protein
MTLNKHHWQRPQPFPALQLAQHDDTLDLCEHHLGKVPTLGFHHARPDRLNAIARSKISAHPSSLCTTELYNLKQVGKQLSTNCGKVLE